MSAVTIATLVVEGALVCISQCAGMRSPFFVCFVPLFLSVIVTPRHMSCTRVFSTLAYWYCNVQIRFTINALAIAACSNAPVILLKRSKIKSEPSSNHLSNMKHQFHRLQYIQHQVCLHVISLTSFFIMSPRQSYISLFQR